MAGTLVEVTPRPFTERKIAAVAEHTPSPERNQASPVTLYAIQTREVHEISGWACPVCNSDITGSCGDYCRTCNWTSKRQSKWNEKKRISKEAAALGKILWEESGCCAYCGTGREDAWRPGVDHITPKSSGGGNHHRNLVACCGRCNSIKAKGTLEEFRERMRRRFYHVYTIELIDWCASLGIRLPEYESAPQVVFRFESEDGGWSW